MNAKMLTGVGATDGRWRSMSRFQSFQTGEVTALEEGCSCPLNGAPELVSSGRLVVYSTLGDADLETSPRRKVDKREHSFPRRLVFWPSSFHTIHQSVQRFIASKA